jgi:hypothetical protein
MYVGDLTQNAAYLVVLTTDELRSLNAVSNGERIHGFSPIGTVELEIRSAPFLALPVHYRGAAMLVDPGRPLSGDLFWRANTLFIDSNGLHYVEDVDGRWIERLSIPNTKLVAARVRVPFASNARLELDTAQGPGSPLVRHTFAILPPLGSSAYELDHVAGIVAQGIASGWHAERVSVVAATTAPVVEFRDPPTLSSGAGSRIADKALAGGVVTAGVCGICQTGLCPPQMLLSCAGLFAVGAAIGGAVGVGGELLAANAPAAPKAPTLSAQQVQGASPVVSSAAGTMLGQEALRACMQRRAAEGDAWVAQGRRAELALESGSAPFVLEAAVQRVSLVPMGQPGQAVDDLPVQLLVDGKVVLRHAPPGPQEAREWQRTVSWQGPSYTLVQWSAPDGRVLQDSLRGACEGLAESLLRQAQALWLGAN